MPRICIPVCASNIESLTSLARSASALGDIVELRLDCLSESEFANLQLDDLLNSLASDVILTLRDPQQGGHRDLSRSDRANFWRDRLQCDGTALLDIELDLARELAAEGSLTDWSRVVCSHHDFECVPESLDQIYAQLAQTPASVMKIAVRANDVTDCLPLFRLLNRAHADGRQIIAIAMGNAGIATRILGPSRGGFLTYGASDDEKATAPGQVTAGELRALYRIESIDRDTRICGLVGLPALHSVSPHMHNAAFAETKLNATYIPFEVTNASEFFRQMVHPRTRQLAWPALGFSVTAPHKFTVMQSLDWIDSDAFDIGAVNTVVVEGEKLLGYNTDADGFLVPLRQHFGDLRGCRVALIGAGGAANAVVWSLRREKAEVTVFARNEMKAARLAERFGASSQTFTPASFHDYDLLVNTTPLGSLGHEVNQSPATVDQLRGVSLVYDLIYNPSETLLLNQAREAGCKTLNGLQMLVAQAALQFERWTSQPAPVSVMQAAASIALQQRFPRVITLAGIES